MFKHQLCVQCTVKGQLVLARNSTPPAKKELLFAGGTVMALRLAGDPT